ncbi:MAG: hydantoinase B/oxoprolinase family protein [Candidatus Andeanibacterium colombiense]|uniref:Hydantoinase B/oxoprolinase family protein n=1 Tax=Candidatus Andeanibacterium colombiense TaxID=3121345 RepID=A0AAJ5X7M3_9SPHN|nr:MAG: hydantoinase B/oxoprolinase family protein [Sphingomonadaceae bacterium]
MTVDVVTTEIVRNLFLSAAEDMRAVLVRSAFQPLIYENEDAAVALMDRNADVLGQSSGLPLFLGNLDEALKEALRIRGGTGWLNDGDIVCFNDPYIQGTHLNDLTMFGPVFFDGEIVGYVATRADVTDVGGRDPGGGTETTEVYQEGLRLGPIKICTANGPVEDFIDTFRRASRSRELVVGDINAMIASCRTGRQRLAEIFGRFGIATVEACRDEIFRQSAEADRQTVAAIPDGTYGGWGEMDDNGIAIGVPVPIELKLTVAGDRMIVDLTGSPASQHGPVNCGRAQTVAAVRVAYKLLFASDRSFDGGCFANIEVLTRPGSMHHALEPASCAWYYTSLGMLIDLFISAFAEVLPDQVTAAQFGDSMVTYFTGPDPGNSAADYMCVEAHAGGWGASSAGQGADGMINCTNGSFRNTPVEAFEARYPITVTEYGLRRGSGGAGRHRGGCGIVRRYRFDAPAQLFLWFDRSRTPGWGLLGGEAGLPPRVEIAGSSNRTDLLKANGIRLEAGDRLTLMTGGGGGFGAAG